jgi:hypothetical protein
MNPLKHESPTDGPKPRGQIVYVKKVKLTPKQSMKTQKVSGGVPVLFL